MLLLNSLPRWVSLGSETLVQSLGIVRETTPREHVKPHLSRIDARACSSEEDESCFCEVRKGGLFGSSSSKIGCCTNRSHTVLLVESLDLGLSDGKPTGNEWNATSVASSSERHPAGTRLEIFCPTSTSNMHEQMHVNHFSLRAGSASIIEAKKPFSVKVRARRERQLTRQICQSI